MALATQTEPISFSSWSTAYPTWRMAVNCRSRAGMAVIVRGVAATSSTVDKMARASRSGSAARMALPSAVECRWSVLPTGISVRSRCPLCSTSR